MSEPSHDFISASEPSDQYVPDGGVGMKMKMRARVRVRVQSGVGCR